MPRHAMRTSLLLLLLGCGDTTAPRLPEGDFQVTVTLDGAHYALSGGDAAWEAAPSVGVLFSTPESLPGIPGPLIFTVSAANAPLSGGAFVPGDYGLGNASDYFFAAGLAGSTDTLVADSGTIHVRRSRSTAGDALTWDGAIDLWYTDPLAPATPVHAKGTFAATYAPGSVVR